MLNTKCKTRLWLIDSALDSGRGIEDGMQAQEWRIRMLGKHMFSILFCCEEFDR